MPTRFGALRSMVGASLMGASLVGACAVGATGCREAALPPSPSSAPTAFPSADVQVLAPNAPTAAAPADAPHTVASSRGTKPGTTASPPRPPSLVVTLVVDQLAAWVAKERLPLLPSTGGFARLRREGTYVERMDFAHAVTDTAPGHASLYTGATPRVHGVYANERFDEATKEATTLLRDPRVQLIAAGGATTRPGSSAAILRSPSIAHALRAAHPTAYVVSISIKDRGAILATGSAATDVVWFDGKLGFVSSTAFGPSLPPWATRLERDAAFAGLRSGEWTLTDAAWVRAHAFSPDDGPGEGKLASGGTSFPHSIGSAGHNAIAFRASPFADEAVLRLAQEALSAHPPGASGGPPTFVALSLSANDYVGHVFGPDSWEAWDHLLRLDAALGRFFDDLDRRVGADGWAALLTADHGIAPVPEQVNASRAWCTGPRDPYGRPCVPTTRIDPNAVARAAQQAAVAALGPGDWVSGVADPYLYLSKRGATLYPESRERLVSAIAAGIRKKFPDIVRAVDVVQMARSCPRRPGSDGQGDDPRFDLSEDGLLCASFGDEGVPAIYLVTARGSFFDALYTFGAGASHGSPYPFDRAVPLLVRAPGRVGAGRVVAEPVPFTAFAHTVARLLGVPSPADAAPGPSFAAP